MHSELISAYEFAEHAHRMLPNKPENAFRKYGNEPYIVHPLRVLFRVMDLPGYELAWGQVAILHDVAEDTKADLLELHRKFGQDVFGGVTGLTSYSKQINSKAKRVERKKMDLDYLLEQPAWIQAIKLCDIEDNLSDMCSIQEIEIDFLAMYSYEKEEQVTAMDKCAPQVANRIFDLLVKIRESIAQGTKK